MKTGKFLSLISALFFIALTCGWSQDSDSQNHALQTSSPQNSMQSIPSSQMGNMDMSSDSGGKPDSGEMSHTMKSMSGEHMDMGPHMKMTELRPTNFADQQRAQQIVEELRSAIQKYQDYNAALSDGYKIFAPNVPTPMKHFTNWKYAIEAEFRFNPEHPTSLLYEKHGENYKLIGAMLTAPKRYGEDDLDKRVPLSVAQWHEHVDMCAPPKDKQREMYSKNPKFGLAGSITSAEKCDKAGGIFHPIIFNWMVHVYPFETKPADVWSAERQHGGHMHAD